MFNFIKLVEGEIEIIRDEFLLIPEGLEVIKKDKGGVFFGDSEGRNKLYAKKQFALAWWIVDVNSPANLAGLTEVEAMRDGITNLGFPDDWTPDGTFTIFLKAYKREYDKYIVTNVVKELLRSFKTTSLSIKKIRKNIDRLLALSELTAEDTKTLLASNKELQSLAGELPKHIRNLKEASEESRIEQKSGRIARGGVQITKSMQPEN